MKSELHKKIDALVEAGKIYEYSNRCWFTCYMTWTKLRKKEKLRTKLVEGKHAINGTHYWLEIDNKEVCDVHYKLVEQDLDCETDWNGDFVDSLYVKEKTLNLFDLKVDKENYENKPAYNWHGKEKWAKVWDLT